MKKVFPLLTTWKFLLKYLLKLAYFVCAASPLPRYMPLTVARYETVPGGYFYVHTFHVEDTCELLLRKQLLTLLGGRQTGKSTDALALVRELEKAGFKVRLLILVQPKTLLLTAENGDMAVLACVVMHPAGGVRVPWRTHIIQEL